jgi:EpsD family peptidyl-prolyl cis-trans isomerase
MDNLTVTFDQNRSPICSAPRAATQHQPLGPMTTHPKNRYMKSSLAATAAFLSLALAACNHDHEAIPASQVIARVNGNEISVHRLNDMLARIPVPPKEEVPALRRQVLDKLVDQEIAVQQAIDAKLDRKPEVLSAIESAKRDILARAYLDQAASALPKPSAEEVSKYYSQHPELFSERRIYQLQQISVPVSAMSIAQLRDMANGKTMMQIADILRQQKVQFGADSAVRPAEQIPLETLPRINQMKDGETTVLPSGQVSVILHLLASQPAPVSQDQAVQQIQRYLMNQKANEFVAAQMKELRGKAKIDLVGEFAADAAKSGAGTQSQDVKTGAGSGAALTKDNVERGVSGLK